MGNENDSKQSSEISEPQPSTSTETTSATKRLKRKRKRVSSNSDSSDNEPILPDNYMELEKNVHAVAMRNNLCEKSVKTIIKKVVTNDHVLALVQLQEEAERSETEDVAHRPKITRSKAKELMKISPKSAPWNIELTPINHIPVKTRPEVSALIDQDLPDESDEEYEPTLDDVISDDDHTCSDIDSQPRTPATPHSATKESPLIVKDGPFKVPQGLNLSACRRLELEEEATIALRTRSKLSLSATPIEHIESSFIPPDELPQGEIDDLWNKFLTDLDNPTTNHRNEEDDDDPEYNAANDPDAHDEDEEALENSIIKISKKELNDLVTEIFHIMPEDALDQIAEKAMTNGDNIQDVQLNMNRWDGGKGHSDEVPGPQNFSNGVKRISQGKSGSMSEGEYEYTVLQSAEANADRNNTGAAPQSLLQHNAEQCSEGSNKSKVPPLIQESINKSVRTESVFDSIYIPIGVKILPEQIQILEQQLRQHIQLSASNFLQLFIHPVHWSCAPKYKEYLETLNNTANANPNSVVNVCNLRPALELVKSWEDSVGHKTPESEAILKHIENEVAVYRRRLTNNSLYIGKFHPTFQQVVANSTVFLYPYLLPSMPYRPDNIRRVQYNQAEDELIALGLSQFWDYVDENPELYKRPAKVPRHHRWGISETLELVGEHMFPWLPSRALIRHISHIKKTGDPFNPINRFFQTSEIVPVKHKLLSFNPNITLYEQPIHEMPYIWVRFIGNNNKAARKNVSRRSRIDGKVPDGVEVKIGERVIAPKKTPVPIHFTKTIIKNRAGHAARKEAEQSQPILIQPITEKPPSTHGDNGQIAKDLQVPALYSLIQTSNGTLLTPLKLVSALVSPATLGDSNSSVGNLPASMGISTTSSHSSSITLSTNSTISNSNTPLNSSTSFIVTSSTSNLTPFMINSKSVMVNSKSVMVNSTPIMVNSTPIMVNSTPVMVNPTIVPSQVKLYMTENVTNGSPRGTSPRRSMYIENLSARHCSCCKIISDISKKKQTLITRYFSFNNKKSVDQCPCQRKSLPKITNKLRILLDNFKNKSSFIGKNFCSHVGLMKSNCHTNFEGFTNEDDNLKRDPNYLQDQMFVTKYLIKMWMHVSIVKSPYLKKRIHTTFSSFDIEKETPIQLARKIERLFNEELQEFFPEFLVFLNEAQVEKLNKYRDYFVLNHLEDFIRKIKEEVPDGAARNRIMIHMGNVLSQNVIGACYICRDILPQLKEYPKLAEYFFSLFPHRHKDWKCYVTTFDITSPANSHKGRDGVSVPNNDEDGQSDPNREKRSVTRGSPNETDDNKSRNTVTADVCSTAEPMDYSDDCSTEDAEVTEENNDNITDSISKERSIQSSTSTENTHLPMIAVDSDIDKKTKVDQSIKKTVHSSSVEHGKNKYISCRDIGQLKAPIGESEEDPSKNTPTGHKVERMQIDRCNESRLTTVDNSIHRSPKDQSTKNDDHNAFERPQKDQLPFRIGKRNEIIIKEEFIIRPTNYEADESESDEDIPPNKHQIISERNTPDDQMVITIKQEIPNVQFKTEIEDHTYDSSSDASMRIVSDEEYMNINWTREEDKQILQILQLSLSQLKKYDKTVDDVLSENEVYELISNTLSNKPLDDIKKRVLYLFNLLLLSENS